ncbi:hypothetical protein G7Y89_g9455 [Cudoniella acicularis]|uniref:2EXR domain-containing protein n=1 Tax=Cudoniella acicularis TaxID=354080 RepID=A0A8H4RFL2_9HELO|nr:hypothetical protein G7Y89_g9455 [Cudoniella acicularis]
MPATLDFAEVLAKSAGGILTIIILYSLSTGIYNIYFHPLAGIPGPKLWCATRSRNLLSLLTGTLSKEIRQLHEEYGDVIRVAPDEVSFARTEAWHEIYPNAPGRPGFPKSRLWFGTKPGDPISILHALEPKNHARFRKSIERGFTESSLRAQEPIIQKYGEMLISRLKKLVAKKKNENGVVVDVNRWYAFTTFDVIGDLGFGESFGCLESNDYPPWVLMLFNSLRAQTLAVSLRFYPSIDWLLKLAIPKSVMEKEKQHREWSMKKLDRRLNIEKERPDIVSLIKMDDEGINGLTITEMQATCTVIIVAGSETTVAVLSGTTNYLVKNPDKLAILSAELRGKFRSDHDITLSALKDLPYLNAVIQEGMRMCNPVLGGLVRESPPGGRTVCGYFLPAGTICIGFPMKGEVQSGTRNYNETVFIGGQIFLRRLNPDTIDPHLAANPANPAMSHPPELHQAVPKPLTEFTLFPELPTEIQLMIWRASIPKSTPIDMKPYSPPRQRGRAPPAVSCVNRQSQDETRKHFKIISLKSNYVLWDKETDFLTLDWWCMLSDVPDIIDYFCLRPFLNDAGSVDCVQTLAIDMSGCNLMVHNHPVIMRMLHLFKQVVDKNLFCFVALKELRLFNWSWESQYGYGRSLVYSFVASFRRHAELDANVPLPRMVVYLKGKEPWVLKPEDNYVHDRG